MSSMNHSGRGSGVVLIGVVGEGSEGVCVNIFSNPHGPFCEGRVSWGDLNISSDCSTSPARDNECGELAIVLDKVVGAEVMMGDDRGQGCLLAELGDLLLEVVDHVLIGSGAGDKGSGGSLGNLSKALSASSSSKGLEDGEGRVRGEG